METEGRRPLRVLRGAAVYGANGHGKTNLVHAVKFAKELVVQGNADGRIKTRPYKTSSAKQRVPSEFIFNYRHEGTDYEYGFRVLPSHVTEEWLFSSPRGREVKLFERITKKLRNGEFETAIDLGPSLKKRSRSDRATGEDFLQFVAIGMAPSQLFLTETVQRNVKSLRKPFEWFHSCLQVITADSDYAHLNVRAHQDAEFVTKLSDKIRQAGIGIDRIETETRKFDVTDFSEMPADALEMIKEQTDEGHIVEVAGPDAIRRLLTKGEDGELEVVDLVVKYTRSNGDVLSFNQSEESAGTRRLINLLPMLIELSNVEKTYIIDELDRKLHPILSFNLIRSFFENSLSGQLIFTTHNTHLLDLDLFRRDEIWFIEKDSNGVSSAYALSDMRIRPDVEIRKGYLNGRFGAIPFVGDIFGLGWIESTAQ
ncbi:AAA family ATPase [Rhizobium sp. Leaf341]|uniref:AAA family ATPase n=1 Tax=Rhizobium sp. Leaf341 TaxID=1736344 RepID=UPI001FCCFBF7|nr:ATP-binding protein [Rhizobium sp. Leaf341]